MRQAARREYRPVRPLVRAARGEARRVRPGGRQLRSTGSGQRDGSTIPLSALRRTTRSSARPARMTVTPPAAKLRSMATIAATKWVYDFAEGSREMRELLGGKGANIAEMTRVLGPERVPAGFTITTEACVAYMRGGRAAPDGPRGAGRRGARAARGAGRASGSATPTTRCWCPCAAARATRCRA